MLISVKQEQPCINWFIRLCRKKVQGGGGIYILAMVIILFLLVLFKLSLDEKRMYITYDTVDDSLVSSLISASVVNLREYGRGGQLVIYDDVTEDEDVSLGAMELTEEEKAQKLLTSVKLFSPVTDSHLNNSYQKFMNSLKVNLKLDDAMNASISGIDGVVNISDFSVYNKFEYYDLAGNLLHYRFIRYSFNGVSWSAHPYNIDTPVTVFNSFDDTNTVLDSTTVCATLSFRLMVSESSALTGNTDITSDITYQRLVDVTE